MTKIEISHKTIIFTVFFLLSFWFVYQIRSIILIVFIAYLLATALKPLVEFFEKIKLPRIVAVIFSFIIFLGIIVLLLSVIIPTLIEQLGYLSLFIQKQMDYLDFSAFTINQNLITSQIQTISSSVSNILKFILGTASNILAVLSLLILTFYMTLERRNFPNYLKKLFNDSKKEKLFMDMIIAIEKKLGGWVRGELTLMFVVGLLTYIGLILLGIPFALPLAILAGILELIPNLGPTIASIPAILIGLSVSQALAVGAVILSIAVQQLENNLIVPLIMKEAVGLKPMVTLLCMMIGVTLAGIGGAILAIPIFITLQVIVHYLVIKEK